MKLVIFGLTISSSWGNGHATLWRGLCRALIRQGHRVVFFERDVPYYASHRDLTELIDQPAPAPSLPQGKAEICIYPSWEDVRPQVQRHLADADVAMISSYCPDGIVAADLVLSSPVQMRIFYDLDTPVTLDHLRRSEPVPYIGLRGLQDFDLVLSYTGGSSLVELQSRLGARWVVPLYGWVDPQIHHATKPQAPYRADLSYLGTYAQDRQATLETLFIRAAERLPERRFMMGGSMYPQNFPWKKNIYYQNHVSPAEHPAFYCSSLMTLNITRQVMACMGYCPSGRLFEAAACGVPVLSDTWEGLEQFFTPGAEIIIAQTTEDTLQALAMSADDLARVARAAKERTLAFHTAEQRVRELESAIDAVINARIYR